MAASKTEIANLALAHLGHAKQISNIDTETDQEAKTCRQFFEVARDLVLRDFAWSFAQKRFDLSQIETLTDTDSDSEWTYSYMYPTDCLKIHRIMSGTRNDSRQTRVPFEILDNNGSRRIWTDVDDARVEYTARIEIVEQYPPDFVLALSYRLAELICPRLTNGDAFGLKKQLLEYYKIEIANAELNNSNEVQAEELPLSEFERDRA